MQQDHNNCKLRESTTSKACICDRWMDAHLVWCLSQAFFQAEDRLAAVWVPPARLQDPASGAWQHFIAVLFGPTQLHACGQVGSMFDACQLQVLPPCRLTCR